MHFIISQIILPITILLLFYYFTYYYFIIILLFITILPSQLLSQIIPYCVNPPYIHVTLHSLWINVQ